MLFSHVKSTISPDVKYAATTAFVFESYLTNTCEFGFGFQLGRPFIATDVVNERHSESVVFTSLILLTAFGTRDEIFGAEKAPSLFTEIEKWPLLEEAIAPLTVATPDFTEIESG